MKNNQKIENMKTKYSIPRILIIIGLIILSGFIVQGVVPMQDVGIKIWLALFLTPVAITFLVTWLVFGNPFGVYVEEKSDECLPSTPKERMSESLKKDFYEGNWH